MKWNDTAGAKEFAADTSHKVKDVEAHWWEFFSNYRLKQWQNELRKLMLQTGMTTRSICEYTGLAHSERTGFFVKLPRKRTAYIGIGMALKQPSDTINRWISKYGMKRALYVKDVCEDLIWIYLINANIQDRETDVNYFRMFDQCADLVYQTYCELWDDYIEHDTGTAQLMREFRKVSFDEQFTGIRVFVTDHLDAFKTAYARPRRLLAKYTDEILKSMGDPEKTDDKRPLAELRGYLDDSMINYLAGDPETIHSKIRRETGHSLSFKHIPKGRKAHISLALALGMTRDEIDRYLNMMGFTALDAVDQEEGILIHMLEQWEQEHPLQKRWKKQRIEGDSSIEITEIEAQQAVREMLRLRQDLGEEYTKRNRRCPYLK